MKILLIYPKCPDTFWTLKYVLNFIFKKAVNPPLGLLTVASMLPPEWEKKLVDMNVTALNDKDLKWADYVFLSGIALQIQKGYVKEIIDRCKKIGVKIVAGGPLFTTAYKDFEGVDHFVLNEAEITLPLFLEDLRNGCAKHIYTSDQWADIKKTPMPLWGLIDIKKYVIMNVQYSRGCPFDCEFCDITMLYGRKPRTKDKDQLIRELENIYSRGWRDTVFFVDDNFIGNKRKLKNEILPAVAEWMEERRHPFTFMTQLSIDLADDEELMQLMVKAGFTLVFVGIETPHEESLTECAKLQNKNRDLIESVKKIQNFGLQVWGGFIVGFDSDPLSIFEKQIDFIQKSEIVVAMIGLLNPLRNTRLYQRLQKENRLLEESSGDNTDWSINFVPKMDRSSLINGYKKILSAVYSPVNYYNRVRKFLKGYRPTQKRLFRFHFNYLGTTFKSILLLGILGKERVQYWKLIFWLLFRRPRFFPQAATFAIYGYHFRKIMEK